MTVEEGRQRADLGSRDVPGTITQATRNIEQDQVEAPLPPTLNPRESITNELPRGDPTHSLHRRPHRSREEAWTIGDGRKRPGPTRRFRRCRRRPACAISA